MRRRLKVKVSVRRWEKGAFAREIRVGRCFFWISLSSGAFSLDVFPEMPYDVR